jgi:DNA recombination protein RmuC
VFVLKKNKKNVQSNPSVDVVAINEGIKQNFNAINSEIKTILSNTTNEMEKKINKITEESQKALADANAKINLTFENKTKEITEKLNANSKEMVEKYGTTITGIETHIANIQKDADQLPIINQSLTVINNLFQVTKGVGEAGEVILDTLISNIIPNDPDLAIPQFKIGEGKVVDYLIKNEHGQNIAIDSKFPKDSYSRVASATPDNLETETTNFKTSIKNRIDEASKYEDVKNKIDLVVVFIPSEQMYIDIMRWFGAEIRNYAAKKNVILASPTMIIALIKVLLSIKNKNDLINNVGTIIKRIEKTSKDFDS